MHTTGAGKRSIKKDENARYSLGDSPRNTAVFSVQKMPFSEGYLGRCLRIVNNPVGYAGRLCSEGFGVGASFAPARTTVTRFPTDNYAAPTNRAAHT